MTSLVGGVVAVTATATVLVPLGVLLHRKRTSRFPRPWRATDRLADLVRADPATSKPTGVEVVLAIGAVVAVGVAVGTGLHPVAKALLGAIVAMAWSVVAVVWLSIQYRWLLLSAAPWIGVVVVAGVGDSARHPVLWASVAGVVSLAASVLPRWWARLPVALVAGGAACVGALVEGAWRQTDADVERAMLAAAAVLAAWVVAAIVSSRWLNLGWFGWLAGTAAGAGVVAVGGVANRVGVAELLVMVVVGVAFQFSKTTVRLVVVAVAVAAGVGLGAVGHNQVRSDADRAAVELRDDVEAEAAALQDQLHCPNDGNATCAQLDEAVADAKDESGSVIRQRRAAEALHTVRDAAAAHARARAGVSAGTAKAATARRVAIERRIEVELELETPSVAVIEQLQRLLDLRVATERRANTRAEEDAVAAARAEADLEAAVATRDDSPDAPVERSVRDLVVEGADVFVTDTVEPIMGPEVATRLGDIGWVVFGLVLLFGYRGVESLNNRRYGAPVAVGPVKLASAAAGDADDDVVAGLTHRLQARVRASELYEPASVPGQTVSVELSTVLKDSTSVVPGGAAIASIIQVIRAVAFPVPGITATPSYERNGERGYRVQVLLTTTRLGRFLRSIDVDAPKVEDAIDEAGDAIVIDVLNFTKLNPSWARWPGPGAERALRRYQDVERARRMGRPLTVDDQVKALQEARAACPGSAMVKVALAHSYDLCGRGVEALALHLGTRLAHPRYYTARYRLTTSLSMAADTSEPGKGWWAATGEQRDAVVDLLDERGLLAAAFRTSAWRTHVRVSVLDAADLLRRAWPTSGPEQARVAVVLLLLARQEARHLDRLATRPGMLAAALPQGERAWWLGVLRDPRRRQTVQDQVTTLRAIIDLRLELQTRRLGITDASPSGATVDVDEIHRILRNAERVANPARASAAALYNTACLYALVAGDESTTAAIATDEAKRRAVVLLRASLERGSQPTSKAWLERDPDLASLRKDADFKRLLRQLG